PDRDRTLPRRSAGTACDRARAPGGVSFGLAVARMSVATCGSRSPGFRCAHPGFGPTGRGRAPQLQPRLCLRERRLAALERLGEHGAQFRRALGTGLLGRAAIERRLRVIFEGELDELGGLFAGEFGGEREAEVDAGGDAAAREAVAVADDARRNRLGAEGD